MRWYWLLPVLLALIVLLVALGGGRDLEPGEIVGAARPAGSIRGRHEAQREAMRDPRMGFPGASADEAGQILFGDLHVHTTYSIDAYLYSLPIFGGEGAHPPADACDFARHCAALDFFSLNDHAEGLTPERWRASIDTLRRCDALAGEPSNPDLVPYLGWEWTQVGTTPEGHYGHRNVILRGLADDEITTRPIAYRPASDADRAPNRLLLRSAESFASVLGSDYANFLWWLGRILEMPPCAQGADPRTLPDDCLDSATTPAALFEALDRWGLDSIVIPHGLAWGIHSPPGASLALPLAAGQHDPARETVLEIFSGHGNGESYRAALDRPRAGVEDEVCSAPTPDFLPCCWQAGEIMRARCDDLPTEECEARIDEARRLTLAAGTEPYRVFPDAPLEAWLDCDQCRDCFKPVAMPRAAESAQYSLAVSHFPASGEAPLRYRWGFIASSDNHTARAATGYKQFARKYTTDSRGTASPRVDALAALMSGGAGDPRRPAAVTPSPRSFDALFDTERSVSFMYPGGLVAVHARGRDRDSIWQGLVRREVYGTSGPRILLWFDLRNGEAGREPMGSVTRVEGSPRFVVRAVGALRQKPGCPDYATAALGPERIASLCRGECYNPGETRHPIAAIEIVRIRPQTRPGQPIAERIEDPWLHHDCAPEAAGCVFEFEDAELAAHGAETVYYARALQAQTPAINGANLRTRFDAEGKATSIAPCYGGHRGAADDLCLAPVQERAWSSPIYVSPGTKGSTTEKP